MAATEEKVEQRKVSEVDDAPEATPAQIEAADGMDKYADAKKSMTTDANAGLHEVGLFDSGEDSSDPRITILENNKPFTKGAPTIAFLDYFRDAPQNYLNGDDNPIQHGEVSAGAAEGIGYNVYRIQTNPVLADDKDHIDFADQLYAINDAIDGGKLALGKGDSINVSLGNNVTEKPGSGDPTFEDASKMLGLHVTADNLKEMRPKILERARELAEDESQTAEIRATMKRVVDTNNAIAALQAKGIEVVQAAGNDEANRFSWDFLNAAHQLSATDLNGKTLDTSAKHALTEDVLGVQALRYKGVDMLDPTPIKDQDGEYVFDTTGAEIDAADYGGTRLGIKHWRKTSDGVDYLPADTNAVQAETALATPDNKAAKMKPPGDLTSNVTYLDLNDNPSEIYFKEKINIPKDPEKGIVAAAFEGTSFGNIDFYAKNLKRFQALKLQE